MVSYRPSYPSFAYDITHTRNIRQGGMLLTTARAFAPDALLAIKPNLPGRGSPRRVPGPVESLGSREVVQNLLYETYVRFVDLDRRSFQIIADFCTGKAEPLAAIVSMSDVGLNDRSILLCEASHSSMDESVRTTSRSSL